MIQIDERIKEHIKSLITDGVITGVVSDDVYTSSDGVSEFLGDAKIYILTNTIEKPLSFLNPSDRVANILIIVISDDKLKAHNVAGLVYSSIGPKLDRDDKIISWIDTDEEYTPLLDSQRNTSDFQIARTFVIDYEIE